MTDTVCIYENARIGVSYLFGRPMRFEADKAAARDDILDAFLKGHITQQEAKRQNADLEKLGVDMREKVTA